MDWLEPYSERFRDRKVRVCIAFVGYADVYAEVFDSYFLWALQAGKRLAERFELTFAHVTKKEQYRARNYLVDQSEKHGADFMLFMDDDHTISDSPNLIEDFYAEEKPLQGGLYVQRTQEFTQPVIVKYDAEMDSYRWAFPHEVPPNGGPVDVLGGGCNWIDMRLLAAIKQPHWWPFPYDRSEVVFLPDQKYGLDLQLCIAAKKVGVQPWLNGKVNVGHVMNERTILRPGTPPVRCEHCSGIASWTGYAWKCVVCEGVTWPKAA